MCEGWGNDNRGKIEATREMLKQCNRICIPFQVDDDDIDW